MKVYGIWYADYSNSSVDNRVFTSKDDAVAICRVTGGSLQEFDLDTPLDETEVAMRALRPGEMVYRVSMRPDGHVAQVWSFESVTETKDGLDVRVNSSGNPETLNGTCWAANEKHAIKIINERRTRWIAEGSRIARDKISHGECDYGWRKALGVA